MLIFYSGEWKDVKLPEYMDPSWFCIGVQWHPQSDNATALDTQLFECFVQACAGGYVEREVELAA